MSKGVICVAIISVLAFTANADDEVTVERWDNPNWVFVSSHDERTAFTLNTAPGETYRIWVDSPGPSNMLNIGTVTVTGSSPATERTILIGKPNTGMYSPVTAIATKGAWSLGGLELGTNNLKLRLQITVLQHLNGPVEAYELGACEIGGDVTDAFSHNVDQLAGAEDMGNITAGRVTAPGSINCYKADAPRIDITGAMNGEINVIEGDLGKVAAAGAINSISVSDGNIGISGITPEITSTGAIDDIIVTDGDIGTPTSLVTITADDGTDLIDCDALYADITANDGGTGGVRRIITRVGPFEGSLTAEYVGESGVPNWLNVRTDLDAVIDVEDPLEQRAFIGRSFLEDAEINLPANGLQNVITINTLGNEDAVWEGTVNVGTTALTGPDYTPTNTSLGNGGVAMVEYDDPDLFRTGAQGSDCEPEHNSVVVPASTSSSDGLYEVTMRFYGYVDIDGSEPLTITMSPFNNQWISDVTDEYEVELGDPVAGGLVRELVISRTDEDPFPYGYKFTFTPTTDLQSDGTSITYDIAPDGYWFWIATPFDLNRNMAVDTPDIDVWLNDPSDLNGDTYTDQQDLEDLVEAVVNGG